MALAIALPVGVAVLVVVVIDKLKEVLGLAGVVDDPARVGDKGRGAVIGIYGEHLAVRKEGVALVRGRHVPGFGRFLVRGQLAEVLVGEAAEAAVESPFGPQVEVGEIDQFQVHTYHLVPGRQAVGKAHKGLIGAIGDLVAGLGYRQEDLLAPGIGLEVGGDLYAVVVGHHQLEFELLGLAEGAHFFGWTKIVANVVDKLNHVRAAHFQNALAPHATAHQGHDLRVQFSVDDHLIDEKRGPGLLGFGRIVGDANDDPFDIARVLRAGQQALERVVAEAQLATGIGHIDPRQAQLGEIAHLGHAARPEQAGRVFDRRSPARLVERSKSRRVEPRSEEGYRVLVGEKIPLQPVERGLGKSQGGERRADGVAHCQRSVELTVAGRRDDKAVEPSAKAGALQQGAALAQGTSFGPIVDDPAAIDVLAEEVVVASAFEQDVDVARVVVARVVAVLPAAPLIFVVQVLRQVPLAPVGCQGTRMDAHPANPGFLNWPKARR